MPASADAILLALRTPPPGPVHLVPFVPAGFGGLDVTAAALRGLSDAGASVLEVGIPFSDPIADGPTIQAAYHEALEAGTTLGGTLAMLGDTLPSLACPALTMVSYSIVFRAGRAGGGGAGYCERVKAAGAAGVLCPDLPPPEAEAFCKLAKDAGLAPVLLVSPTTPPARRDLIGRLGGGFVYYLSVAGITGERDRLPPELEAGVADMRGRTDLPVCVGFGIGTPRHVAGLKGVADGAIVGTAFVRRMDAARRDGPEAVAGAVSGFARDLIGR